MTRELTLIGYWQSQNEPQYPNPIHFVDPNWDHTEKQKVLDYLDKGEEVMWFRGHSWCRFHCGHSPMGSAECSDGTYVWPEGFKHYLEVHDVKPPQEFIEHCLSNTEIASFSDSDELAIETGWWLSKKEDNPQPLYIPNHPEGEFHVKIPEGMNPETITKFMRRFSQYKSEKNKKLLKSIKNGTFEVVGSRIDILEVKKDGEALGFEFIFRV